MDVWKEEMRMAILICQERGSTDKHSGSFPHLRESWMFVQYNPSGNNLIKLEEIIEVRYDEKLNKGHWNKVASKF